LLRGVAAALASAAAGTFHKNCACVHDTGDTQPRCQLSRARTFDGVRRARGHTPRLPMSQQRQARWFEMRSENARWPCADAPAVVGAKQTFHYCHSCCWRIITACPSASVLQRIACAVVLSCFGVSVRHGCVLSQYAMADQPAPFAPSASSTGAPPAAEASTRDLFPHIPDAIIDDEGA
jgi:hypothetical protein